MTPEGNGKHFEFHPLGQREVGADFDGGAITSDGGGLLLREVEKRTELVERFASCCTDHRQPKGSRPSEVGSGSTSNNSGDSVGDGFGSLRMPR